MQNNTTYELRVNYSDGFEIQKISAGSIAHAERIALSSQGALSTTLLAIIDRRPQEFLAW